MGQVYKSYSRAEQHERAKQSEIWKADSSGNIRQSEAESALRCEVGSELEVLNALRRRGIAYELANLMSYEVHETIVNLFFTELQREPIDGFKKTMLGQLSVADREVHLRLAERTRAGLPLGPGGIFRWISMLKMSSSSLLSCFSLCPSRSQ